MPIKTSVDKKILIEVSARHVHLSKTDMEKIFGKGYELKRLKDLTQLSDFAAMETLEVRAGHKRISNVRVVGPNRSKTQVELSTTDAVHLGIKPPVRLSGDLEQSLGVMLSGPEGRAELKEGVIIPQRHIHLSPNEAKKLKLKDSDMVLVKVKGERPITFHKVRIRINKDYRACLHLDTDEGNAAGINQKGEGEISA